MQNDNLLSWTDIFRLDRANCWSYDRDRQTKSFMKPARKLIRSNGQQTTQRIL